MTPHDALVSAIYERGRRRGLGVAHNLGSASPEDTVQDASVILLRLPRIAATIADQDGLWLLAITWALKDERAVARQARHRGSTVDLAGCFESVLPTSPSAESVALRDQIEPAILVALSTMMPSDRVRFRRRLGDWKRHAEPFAPAVEALAQTYRRTIR